MLTVVFSYGSNSTSQLRARVKNPELKSYGAYLEGYVRVFCYDETSWGGGGVASIAPTPKGEDLVRGAIVRLSDEELKLLDSYERGYRKEKVCVKLKKDNRSIDAIVYVAGSERKKQAWTPSMTVLPSEQYLTAIHLMLREHWDIDEIRSIRINTAESGTVRLVKTWNFPSKSKLSLKSFCVEINAEKKDTPWVMPMTIHEFVSKMKRIGVLNVFDLYQVLPSMNARLIERGEKKVGVDTLSAISRIPFTEGWV